MHMGDIHDRIIVPDAVSLNYNAIHQAEITGYTATDAGAWAASDEFIGRPNLRGNVIYRTLASLLTYIGSSFPADWLTAIGLWLTAEPYKHAHHAHTELDHDDHPQYVKLDGDKDRNKMSGTIGDSSGALSIAPSSRILYYALSSQASLDWNNSIAYAYKLMGGPKQSIDWQNRMLKDVTGDETLNWYTTGIVELVAAAVRLLISVVTDSDPADLTAGAFVCKGGAAVTKQMVVGTHLTVKVGNVDVQTAANYYKHNSNNGVTIADFTSGGIVCGADIVKKVIQIPDAAGTLYNYEILARPI